MKNMTFAVLSTLTLITTAASCALIDPPTELDPNPFEPEPEPDPCAEVRTWCALPFTWPDDPTGRCYCPCSGHAVCKAAPVESLCGLLVTVNDAGEYERVFPEGAPFVCRVATSVSEVP